MKFRVESMNDEALIKLFREGEQWAFGVLYQRYTGPVMNKIRSRVKVREDAEDLFHDFMLHLSEKLLCTYQEKGQFKCWLYRILNNYICSYFRKKKQILVELNVETYDGLFCEDDPDFIRFKEKRLLCLHEFLMSLPEKTQLLLSVRYWHGKTYKEVAECMNINYPTVVSRIRVLQKKIIIYMEERGCDHYEF